MKQCQGGFCKVREDCAHYHAPAVRWQEPANRLCPAGEDKPHPIATNRAGSIRLHQSMAEAHMVMVQALKYPDTVNQSAVALAMDRIAAFCRQT
jgi:hypothetical protein